MICKHCGKEIEEGLSFCIFCGEPQEEGAVRPVPERKTKKSGAGPFLIVLAFAALVGAALWLFVFQGQKSEKPPVVVVDEGAYETLAREFAQAILLGDLDTIGRDVHPQMKASMNELFSSADFVFESCTLGSAEVRKTRRTEERSYENILRSDYGIEATIDDAYEVILPFEAVYHGKPYEGEMTVLVADMDGGRYVIESILSDMELAFYEDNYDEGDYYFDTHSEE